MLEQYKISELKFGEGVQEGYRIPLNKAFYIHLKVRGKSTLKGEGKSKFFCSIESECLKEGMMSPDGWSFSLMDYQNWADHSDEAVEQHIASLRDWWNSI